MARREKKPKKNREEEREMAMDRLSDLPDSILLHILSFLPRTKQCVQTTVLSKRWKCLWTSLPVLIFDKDDDCRTNASFMKLVRRVLSERENLPLTKFSYKYRGVDKVIISKIPRIINYAVTHNVQHFSLCLKSAPFTLLLPVFNSCTSLKTLRLHCFKELHQLKDFTLPCLTTLYLSCCSFWDEDDDEPTSLDPFVGLFNLKCLQLDSCKMGSKQAYRKLGSIRNFKINGPQLDSLSIRKSSSYDDFKIEIEIVAPQLRFFCFKEGRSDRVEFTDLDFPLLEMADIDVFVPWLDKESEIKESLVYIINLFRWLYHVKSLVLTSDTIQGLMKCPGVLEEDQASPLVRLKTLKVKYGGYCESFFNLPIPDNVMKYFGENITVEKIKK